MSPARLVCTLVLLSVGALAAQSQEPASPQPVATADLTAAIGKLGNLDFETRAAAAQLVRRTPAAQAVPALLTAVSEHADGYVRYRALVLLTGFNDPRTKDAMRESMTSPNDRLRTVAYSFFEHQPDQAPVDDLMAMADKELGEFVRPALVRALAAHARDGRVQQMLIRDAGRGEDYFRSAVIEALGDYKARYAVDTLVAIARQDGPLQDDAALALGKIGEARALETLAALQQRAPRPVQPYLAAAICLLGINCGSHEGYLIDTLKFADQNPGFQELLRGAAAGLGALALGGRSSAVDALFSVGIPSRDPTRAPVALALATIALRNTPMMMTALAAHPDRPAAIALLAEGFDMLEEDLAKERFFAFARRSYWGAPEGSPQRALMQALIADMGF